MERLHRHSQPTTLNPANAGNGTASGCGSVLLADAFSPERSYLHAPVSNNQTISFESTRARMRVAITVLAGAAPRG